MKSDDTGLIIILGFMILIWFLSQRKTPESKATIAPGALVNKECGCP